MRQSKLRRPDLVETVSTQNDMCIDAYLPRLDVLTFIITLLAKPYATVGEHFSTSPNIFVITRVAVFQRLASLHSKLARLKTIVTLC